MRLSTAFPAWKDIWVTPQDATLGAYARLNVKILLADGLYPVLFEGVLAKRPGDTVCRIRINDIVAPWLRPQLRALADDEGYYRDPPSGVSAPGFFAYFYVLFSDPEGTVTSDSVSVPVFADWSRDRAPGANAGNQAYLRMAPIDGVADPRQYILISTLTGQSLTFGEVSLTKEGLVATEPVTWYMRAGRPFRLPRAHPSRPLRRGCPRTRCAPRRHCDHYTVSPASPYTKVTGVAYVEVID